MHAGWFSSIEIKTPSNSCFGLRFNVPTYILSFFLNVETELSVILFGHMMDKCVPFCRARARVKKLEDLIIFLRIERNTISILCESLFSRLSWAPSLLHIPFNSFVPLLFENSRGHPVTGSYFSAETSNKLHAYSIIALLFRNFLPLIALPHQHLGHNASDVTMLTKNILNSSGLCVVLVVQLFKRPYRVLVLWKSPWYTFSSLQNWWSIWAKAQQQFTPLSTSSQLTGPYILPSFH